MSRKRYPEAARVLLDYAKDIREAVIALVNGNQFSEAQRVVECLFYPIIYDQTAYHELNKFCLGRTQPKARVAQGCGLSRCTREQSSVYRRYRRDARADSEAGK